jgi:hypothetical protein
LTAAWHELYDLENDPSESNNLAADNMPKLRSMLKTMAGELEAKAAQYPERNGRRRMCRHRRTGCW